MAKDRKSTKKLRSFFVNNQNKPKPILILVAIALFAFIGVKVLYSAFAAGETLYLQPASGSFTTGSTLAVTVRENSGTTPVNAADLTLNYDQTKLQFANIDSNTSAFDISATPSTQTAGTVKITRAKSGTNLTGDQQIAIVNFTVIGNSNTNISFAASSVLAQPGNPPTYVNPIMTGGNYTVLPGVPTGLAAGMRTATTIPLTWSAPTGATGYNVYRSLTVSGTYTKINTSTVSTNSYTDTGLTPNTPYFYKVTALNASNNESAQTAALSTSTTPDTTNPGTMSAPALSTRTETSITISYTAPTDDVGVTGYYIWHSTTSGGTYTQLNADASPVSGLTYAHTGLTPNSPHFYKVQARDAAGNRSTLSAASVQMNTLADTTAPNQVSGISSSNITTNAITINWSAGSDNVGVVGYNVYRSTTDSTTPFPSGNKVNSSLITSTSLVNSSLSQNTQYYFKVTAVDAAGNESAQQTTSTQAKTLSKPGDINSDGLVDVLDLSILATNFGQCGRTFGQGNLDGSADGCVNVLDLSVLATNWGT